MLHVADLGGTGGGDCAEELCLRLSPAYSSGSRVIEGSQPRAMWLNAVDALRVKRPRSSAVCRPSADVSFSSTFSLTSFVQTQPP